MSVPTISFLTLNATVSKMADAARQHSLGLVYNAVCQKFTVTGSSHLNVGAIQTIFSEKKYDCYSPLVLDEKDGIGDWMVVLQQTELPGLTFLVLAAMQATASSGRLR